MGPRGKAIDFLFKALKRHQSLYSVSINHEGLILLHSGKTKCTYAHLGGAQAPQKGAGVCGALQKAALVFLMLLHLC